VVAIFFASAWHFIKSKKNDIGEESSSPWKGLAFHLLGVPRNKVGRRHLFKSQQWLLVFALYICFVVLFFDELTILLISLAR
jgi:hypothetical protein